MIARANSNVVDSAGSGVEATEATVSVPLLMVPFGNSKRLPVTLSNDAVLVIEHRGELTITLPG